MNYPFNQITYTDAILCNVTVLSLPFTDSHLKLLGAPAGRPASHSDSCEQTLTPTHSLWVHLMRRSRRSRSFIAEAELLRSAVTCSLSGAAAAAGCTAEVWGDQTSARSVCVRKRCGVCGENGKRTVSVPLLSE